MSVSFDETYLKIVSEVLNYGHLRDDRTGVGTKGVFDVNFKAQDIGNNFPLLLTKTMAWKSIIAETLWFLQGRSDLESLRADGCKWWDDWEKEDGTLGPVYGKQLRHWQAPDGREIDQVEELLHNLEIDPFSRRHILTMWNPADLQDMALPPCHGVMIQFYFDAGKNRLNLKMNMRSSDLFLGLPTNVPSYALILLLVCRHLGMIPGDLSISLGDAHIYQNHFPAVEEQLDRWPSLYGSTMSGPFPTVSFTKDAPYDLNLIRPEHIVLNNYNPMGRISAPVAV